MIDFGKLIFFILFIFLDMFTWIIIHLLPAKFVLKIINSRPWRILRINLSSKETIKFKTFLRKIILKRTYSFDIFSSCLSKCISGRVMLDIVNIPNTLNLAIYLSDSGFKLPHAYLEDSSTGFLFTTNTYKEIKVVKVLK